MTGLGRARIDEVKTVVAAYHGLTKADLDCRSRKRRLAIPRQKAIALAYELTGHSYPSLGRSFGGRDHTTCLYADRKIKAQEAADEQLAAELNECRTRIARLVSERVAKMVAYQGASSPWSPPAPIRSGMLISKPSTVIASIDADAWLACAA